MDNKEKDTKTKKRSKKYNLVKSIVLQIPHNAHFGKIDQFLWCLDNISKKQTLKDFKKHKLKVAGLKFKNPNFAFNHLSAAASSLAKNSSLIPSYSKFQSAELLANTNSTSHQSFDSSASFPSIATSKPSMAPFSEQPIVFQPFFNQHNHALSKQLDFRLTENTSFYFIENKYKFVIAIDVSKSVFSLDTETGRPVIDNSIKTLAKCLKGIINSFTLNSDLLSNYKWQPSIYVSVIAIYGSLNSIQQKVFDEYLSEQDGPKNHKRSRSTAREYHAFPSFCTLAHSVYLKSQNISELINNIYKKMNDYVQEVKSLTQNINDCLESLLLDSESQSFLDCLNDPSIIKTASSCPIVECLKVAKHTLMLLPSTSSASFAYITDGVFDSSINAANLNSITSWFVENSVNSTVIQVAANSGFNPTVTFGNVADNELIRFLAVALEGNFFYSSDCPDIIPFGEVNFYHDNLLIKKLTLCEGIYRDHMQAVHIGLPRLSDIPREWLNKHPERPQRNLNNLATPFPWEEKSFSPVVETLEARYREYQLPIGLGLIIQARVKEGFILTDLKIVPLDPTTFISSSSSNPGTKTNSTAICEQIITTFKLPWLPNVTIFYQISSTYINGEIIGSGKNNISNNLKGSIPRSESFQNYVKINIRSYKLFTLLFLESSHEDNRSNIIARKARSLHIFLKSLVEKDQKLKVLYTHNPNSSILLLKNSGKPGSNRQNNSKSLILSKLDEQELYIYKVMSSWIEQDSNCLSQLAGFECVDTILLSNFYIESSIKNLKFQDIKNVGKKLLSEFISEYFLSYNSSVSETTDKVPKLQQSIDTKSKEFSSDLDSPINVDTTPLLNNFVPIGDKNHQISICFLDKKWCRFHGSRAFAVIRWNFITDWAVTTTISLFNGNQAAHEMILKSIYTFIENFFTKSSLKNKSNKISSILKLSQINSFSKSDELGDLNDSRLQNDFNSNFTDSESQLLHSKAHTSALQSEIQTDEVSSQSINYSFFDSDSFLPLFKAERPIHLILTPTLLSNSSILTSTSNLINFSPLTLNKFMDCSSHVKKYEWEWEYVPTSNDFKIGATASDKFSFLNSEGRMEILQTLYRVAGEICYTRLLNCYMILSISNAALKVLGKHRGAKSFPDLNNLHTENNDTFIDYLNPEDYFRVVFYNEVNSDDEVLILQSCIYAVEVDIARLCIRTEIWIEPFFEPFLTSIIEEDSTLMVPIASFQKILMPNRKFERVSRKVSFNSNNTSLFAPVSMLTKSRYQLRLLEIPLFHFPTNSITSLYHENKTLDQHGSKKKTSKILHSTLSPIFDKEIPSITLNGIKSLLKPMSNKNCYNNIQTVSSNISLTNFKPIESQARSQSHQASLLGLNTFTDTKNSIQSQNFLSKALSSESSTMHKTEHDELISSKNRLLASSAATPDSSKSTESKKYSQNVTDISNNQSSNSLFLLPKNAIMDHLIANNDNKLKSNQNKSVTDDITTEMICESHKISTSAQKNSNDKDFLQKNQDHPPLNNSIHNQSSETSTYILEKSVLLDSMEICSNFYTQSANIIGYLKKEQNPLILRSIDTKRKLNSSNHNDNKINKEYMNLKSVINKIVTSKTDSSDLFISSMYNIRNSKNISPLLFRLFLEYALFQYCDAMVVLNVNFYQLKFTSKLMQQLSKIDPLLKISSTASASSNDNSMLDKWYVKRLLNKESFLFITFPNITTSTGTQAFSIKNTPGYSSSMSAKKDTFSTKSNLSKSKTDPKNTIKCSNLSSINRDSKKTKKNIDKPEESVRWLIGSESEAPSIESYSEKSSFNDHHNENFNNITQNAEPEFATSKQDINHLQSYTLAFECSSFNKEYTDRNISLTGINDTPSIGVDFSMEITDIPFTNDIKNKSKNVELENNLKKLSNSRKVSELINTNNNSCKNQLGYAFSGCTSKQKYIPYFSPEAKQELLYIEKLYHTATAQSVYLSLLLNYRVSSSIFSIESIPQSLRSSTLQFDITEYLHTLDISRANRSANSTYLSEQYKAIEYQTLNNNILKILSKDFSMLTVENYEIKSISGTEKFDKLKNNVCGTFRLCSPLQSNGWTDEKLVDFALFPLYIKVGYRIEIYEESSNNSNNTFKNKKVDPVNVVYVDRENLPVSINDALKLGNIDYNPYELNFLKKPNVNVVLCIECFYPVITHGILEPKSESFGSNISSSNSSVNNFSKLNNSVIDCFPKTHYGITTELCNSIELYFMRETLFYLHDTILKTENILNKTWAIISNSHEIFKEKGSNGFNEFCINDINLHFKEILRDVNQMYSKKVYKSSVVSSSNGFAEIAAENSILLNFSNLSSALNVENSLNLFKKMLCKQSHYPGKLSKVGDIFFLEIANPIYGNLHEINKYFNLHKKYELKDNNCDIENYYDNQNAFSSNFYSFTEKLNMIDHNNTLDQATIPIELSNVGLKYNKNNKIWLIMKINPKEMKINILSHCYIDDFSDSYASLLYKYVIDKTKSQIISALKDTTTQILLEQLLYTHSSSEILTVPQFGLIRCFDDVYTNKTPDAYSVDFSNHANHSKMGFAQGIGGYFLSDNDIIMSFNTSNYGDNPKEKLKPDTSLEYNQYIVNSMGYYQCPEQAMTAFPIHSKISSSKILQSIASSELGNNRIENRDNMYVIKHGEEIYYLKFTTQELPVFGSMKNTEKHLDQDKDISSHNSIKTPHNFQMSDDKQTNVKIKNRTSVKSPDNNNDDPELNLISPNMPNENFPNNNQSYNSIKSLTESSKASDLSQSQPMFGQKMENNIVNPLIENDFESSQKYYYNSPQVNYSSKKNNKISNRLNAVPFTTPHSYSSPKSISPMICKDSISMSPKKSSYYDTNSKPIRSKLINSESALNVYDSYKSLPLLHQTELSQKYSNKVRSSNSIYLTNGNKDSLPLVNNSLRVGSAKHLPNIETSKYMINSANTKVKENIETSNKLDIISKFPNISKQSDSIGLTPLHHSSVGIDMTDGFLVDNACFAKNQTIFNIEDISNENSNCPSTTSVNNSNKKNYTPAFAKFTDLTKDKFTYSVSKKSNLNLRRYSEVCTKTSNTNIVNSSNHKVANSYNALLQNPHFSIGSSNDTIQDLSKIYSNNLNLITSTTSAGYFEHMINSFISNSNNEHSNLRNLSTASSFKKAPPKIVKTQSFTYSTKNTFKELEPQVHNKFYLIMQIFGLKSPPKKMVYDTVNYLCDFIKNSIVMPELALHIDRNTRLNKDDFDFMFNKNNSPVTFYLPIPSFDYNALAKQQYNKSFGLKKHEKIKSPNIFKSSSSNISDYNNTIKKQEEYIDTTIPSNTRDNEDSYLKSYINLFSKHFRRNLVEIVTPFTDCFSNSTTEIFGQCLANNLEPCLKNQIPINQFISLYMNSANDFFKAENYNSDNSLDSLYCSQESKKPEITDSAKFKFTNLPNDQIYADDKDILTDLSFLYHLHPHLKSKDNSDDYGRGIASIQVAFTNKKFLFESFDDTVSEDYTQKILDILFKSSNQNYSLKLQLLHSFIKNCKSQILNNYKEQYDWHSRKFERKSKNNQNATKLEENVFNQPIKTNHKTKKSSKIFKTHKNVRLVSFTVWPIGNIKVKDLISKIVDLYWKTTSELLVETVIIPRLILPGVENSLTLSKEENDIYQLITFLGKQKISSISVSNYKFIKISKSLKTFAHTIHDLITNISPKFNVSMIEKTNSDNNFDYNYSSTVEHYLKNSNVYNTLPSNDLKNSMQNSLELADVGMSMDSNQALTRSFRREKLSEKLNATPTTKNRANGKASKFVKDSGKMFCISSFYCADNYLKNLPEYEFCDWTDEYSSDENDNQYVGSGPMTDIISFKKNSIFNDSNTNQKRNMSSLKHKHDKDTSTLKNAQISVKRIKKYAAVNIKSKKSQYPLLEIQGLKKFDPNVVYNGDKKLSSINLVSKKSHLSHLYKKSSALSALLKDHDENTILKKMWNKYNWL
ncbi:hypothetical protein BB561_003082 [Smittium simulii]|uniref:Uncharacterized protein n=1 Tax=Smittium simulii TaxID=133385 RepID=A0A2T9YN03_9FUNG|nr:hypothetical protein BB561_003082 [Smittium simulii]